MSQFQLIVIAIAMTLALVGVLILSGVIPGFSFGGGGTGTPININLWGTVPSGNLGILLKDINQANKNSFTFSYVEKNPATFENDLVEALASGQGPDMWLLSQDYILEDKDKIVQIPFASYNERSFKDAFISEGELFLTKDGIVAFPFMVDPIVLYWNRDLFEKVAIANPPKIWDDFVNFSQRLTVRDTAGNVTQSGAAFGEFNNVDHAEDLISLLILQTGNPIVNPSTLRSELASSAGGVTSPAESAIRFFTGFSDPVKTTYSWNRSLPSAKNAFVGGTLAMYFGYASEYKDISAKNPHLNFDVSEVPQIAGGKINATYANMLGLAISKSSLNQARLMAAAVALTATAQISELTDATFLPPVRRSLLAGVPKDPALAVFYKSAIQARGWLKPDPVQVSALFQSMIENVVTGKKRIGEAISNTHSKIDAMLSQY